MEIMEAWAHVARPSSLKGSALHWQVKDDFLAASE